ncbi:hypothetical protein DPMN_184345 [Dreissena polymorpha]|uniref:Uncharacterized protein n=1 Tax=Dreissena polymorpha TaxID=45954 RepID=A0A9D4I6A7_DREPO|nr:hypothetical protein DPMN_184345 [Dreissena polymorpha]
MRFHGNTVRCHGIPYRVIKCLISRQNISSYCFLVQCGTCWSVGNHGCYGNHFQLY